MRILSWRKKGTEFGRVAETGEGGLVLEPRGECCRVFAFFFRPAKSFEGAFAVVIQGAHGRYLAQPPYGVRVRTRRQFKISARVRNVFDVKTLLSGLHSLDENAAQRTPDDAELLRVLLMFRAIAQVGDLPLDFAAKVGARAFLTQSGQP